MINHKFFEFIPYFSTYINDVIITFRTRQPPAEKVSMQYYHHNHHQSSYSFIKQQIGFAISVHFFKSGFSDIFHAKSGYPDFIRIFFCAGPYRPYIYRLAIVSDTGDVGLLMKIEMQ